MLTLRKKMCLR